MRSNLTSSTSVNLLAAPPAAAIEEFLLRHQNWITTAIGCPVADAIAFEFHLPFDHHALNDLFRGLPVNRRSISYTPALQPVVVRWEIPPETVPYIGLGMSRNREAGVAEGKFGWDLNWMDTPLAIWLKGCAHALISASIPYMPATGRGDPSSQSLLIVNKREMPEVLRIAEDAPRSSGGGLGYGESGTAFGVLRRAHRATCPEDRLISKETQTTSGTPYPFTYSYNLVDEITRMTMPR
jgi:hypothetical protein